MELGKDKAKMQGQGKILKMGKMGELSRSSETAPKGGIKPGDHNETLFSCRQRCFERRKFLQWRSKQTELNKLRRASLDAQFLLKIFPFFRNNPEMQRANPLSSFSLRSIFHYSDTNVAKNLPSGVAMSAERKVAQKLSSPHY